MFLETEKRPQGEPSRENSSPSLAEWQRSLLKAADLLQQRGWCQGAFRSAGRLCTLGAMDAAEGGGDFARNFEAWERMERATGGNVASWNDRPERTADEVVAKLRSVALGG